MNFQVFGCPSCDQPFQVAAAQAGQIVQCPTCAQQVEIPSDAFGEPPPREPTTDAPAQIFACPNCQGQFGITPDMQGQQVGCPHCQTNFLIGTPESDPEVLAPEIVTDRIPSRKSKRNKSVRKTTDAASGAAKDLFAPGFKDKSLPPKPRPTGKSTEQKPTEKMAQSPPVPPPPPPFPANPDRLEEGQEKQRWRSPKQLPPSKPIRKPPSKPASKSASKSANKPATPKPPKESKPAAAKRRKPKFRESPAAPAASKTKRLAYDATTELGEPLGESPVAQLNRASDANSNAIDANAVEPPTVETKMPETSQGQTAKKKHPPAGLESKPVEPQPKPSTTEPGTSNQEQDSLAESANPVVINQPKPIDHLLPPRFDVLDPSQLNVKSANRDHKVLIPDGKGGMAQVDQRVVRIEHDGERVALVAMTAEQKKRRKLIQNIVAIIIGIAIMALAFWLLN